MRRGVQWSPPSDVEFAATKRALAATRLPRVEGVDSITCVVCGVLAHDRDVRRGPLGVGHGFCVVGP